MARKKPRKPVATDTTREKVAGKVGRLFTPQEIVRYFRRAMIQISMGPDNRLVDLAHEVAQLIAVRTERPLPEDVPLEELMHDGRTLRSLNTRGLFTARQVVMAGMPVIRSINHISESRADRIWRKCRRACGL